MSRTIVNVLEVSETSGLMKRTHQVEILGGHFDLPEAKVRIEVEWRHGNVVDSGELDVIDYGCKGNEHVVETNTQH